MLVIYKSTTILCKIETSIGLWVNASENDKGSRWIRGRENSSIFYLRAILCLVYALTVGDALKMRNNKKRKTIKIRKRRRKQNKKKKTLYCNQSEAKSHLFKYFYVSVVTTYESLWELCHDISCHYLKKWWLLKISTKMLGRFMQRDRPTSEWTYKLPRESLQLLPRIPQRQLLRRLSWNLKRSSLSKLPQVGS